VLVDDLYLYAAFGGGWLLGRLWPSRHPWFARATLATVAVLLFLLGASFRAIEPAQIARVFPLAVAFAGTVLAVTAGVGLAIRARNPSPSPAEPSPPRRRARIGFPSSLYLVLALFVGYGVGQATPLPTGTLIPIVLAALLALIGYAIDLSAASVRRAWASLLAAVLGAVFAASAFALVGLLMPSASFATGLAFGWYSLAGPLVAARLGATLGLFTFLANFVRELSVMLLSPYLGPRLGGEGLSALGGATSMDTNLYFIVRYGDERSGALALATGLTLTIAASLLVPLVLAL
jgi:uncharacterized membrane protein YbjE (DUF340 family)